MATGCADLQKLGHLKNGFYTVKSPSSNNNKLLSFYCDLTLPLGAKGAILISIFTYSTADNWLTMKTLIFVTFYCWTLGFETVIGYNDVKTAAGIYFYVQRSSNFTSTMTVIPRDLEKLNIGRAMNLATDGVFTAPVNGRYQFLYNALLGSSATVENDVWLRVNVARFGTSSAPAPNHVNMPISATLNLKMATYSGYVLSLWSTSWQRLPFHPIFWSLVNRGFILLNNWLSPFKMASSMFFTHLSFVVICHRDDVRPRAVDVILPFEFCILYFGFCLKNQ